MFSDDPNWPLAPWRVAKNESEAVIRHGTRTWAAIWEQYLQEDGVRRDLDEFVVGNKFDGLLKAQITVRDQADGPVGAGRTHVRLFFLFGDVDVHVLLARSFADDHAFAHFNGGSNVTSDSTKGRIPH